MPWNLLIYRNSEDQVELLVFWGTRRDPRENPWYLTRTRHRHN